MRVLLYTIQHIKSITSFAEGIVPDFSTCMQCLSEKNSKHFAYSQIGSSRAYKRTMVAGKELLNFLDLQEIKLQSIIKGSSWRLYNVYNQQKEVLKPKTVKDY